jgi:hypothetical protein
MSVLADTGAGRYGRFAPSSKTATDICDSIYGSI